MRLPELQLAPLHQRRTQIRSQEKSVASTVISSGYRQHKPSRRSLDTLLDTDRHDPFNKQALRDLRADLRSKLDAARALGDPERTKVDVKRLIQVTTRFMLLTNPELAAAAAAVSASGNDGAQSGTGESTTMFGSLKNKGQPTQQPPPATLMLKARRRSRVGGFVAPPPPGIAASTTGSPSKAPNWSQEQAHAKYMAAVESCVSHATPREMQTDALRKQRNPSYTSPVHHSQTSDGSSTEHEASTVVHVLDSKGQVRTIARYAATVDQVRQSAAVAAIAARRAARGGSTPEDQSISLRKDLKKGQRDASQRGALSESESDDAVGTQDKNGDDANGDTSSSVLASMSKYIEEMKAQDLEIAKRILNQFKQGTGGPTSAISVVASLGLDNGGRTNGNAGMKRSSVKVGFDPSISGVGGGGDNAGRRKSVAPGTAPAALAKRLSLAPTSVTSSSTSAALPLTSLTLDPSPWGSTLSTAAILVLQRHPIERSAHDVHILAESVRHLPAFSPFVNAQQAGGSRVGSETVTRTRNSRSFSTSDTVYQLCKVANIEYFRPNQIVFRQGDSGSKWYVVLRGKVDIQVSPVGAPTTRVTVACLSLGQGFGELALVNNNPRAATVVCCSVPTRQDKHGVGRAGGQAKHRNANATNSHDTALYTDPSGAAGEATLDEEQVTRQRPMPDDLIFLTVDKVDYLRIARTIHQQELQAKIILLSQIPNLAALSAPSSPNYINTLHDEILNSSQSQPSSRRSSAKAKGNAVGDTFKYPSNSSTSNPPRPNPITTNGSTPAEPSTGALSALQSMAAVLRWRTCAVGEVLLKHGQPAAEFYFIRRGYVDVYRPVTMEIGPDGELRAPQADKSGTIKGKVRVVQVKVARKGPGEYFGEEWVCKWGVTDYLSRWAKVKMEDPKTIRARFENLVLGNLNNSGGSVAATALLRGNHENESNQPTAGRAIGEVPTFPSSVTVRVVGDRQAGGANKRRRRHQRRAANDGARAEDEGESSESEGESTGWIDDGDNQRADGRSTKRAAHVAASATKRRSTCPWIIPPWADPADIAMYEKHIGPTNGGMSPGVGAELAVMTIFDGQTRMKGALPLSSYLAWDDEKLRAKWFEAQEKKKWRSTKRNVLKELRVKVRRGDGVGGKVVLGEQDEELDVGRSKKMREGVKKET